MKILYHFRTQGTGAEGVHIAGVAGAFTKLGHEVTFSSPTGVNPGQSAGANPFGEKKQRSLLSRLATKAPGLIFELLEIAYNLVSFMRLRSRLARDSYGLIYERHAFFLCATAFLAQRHGIPLVVEVNELAGDERVRATPWLAPLARLTDRLTFQRASLIVVVSPHLRRRIEALGVPAEKLLVLPNAVSEELLETPADGAAIREQFGCKDALIIGFVGWFVAWHRLDLLLAEFARLAAAEPRLRLLLVGEGPLAEALAAQARELGLMDRVIFTGSVPHAATASYIAAMDICVVPHSNAFRSPIKLFEYMARGRAIVAPRTEPIEAVVEHGQNGILFTPEQPADLAAQLARLIGDPGERQRLGDAARRSVSEHHTWRRNAEAVLAALDRAPATHGRSV